MVNSLFDVVVHRSLSFSISSQSSMRRWNEVSLQVKRESHSDVPMMGLIFNVVDVNVLTRY
jgi:hypothetical protein